MKKSMFNYIINDQFRTYLPLTKDINPYFNGDKGTFTRGKCLSDEDKEIIKKHLKTKTKTVKELVLEYGVSKSTIYNLKY